MLRSAVYLDGGCLRGSGTGLELYRPALVGRLRPDAPATLWPPRGQGSDRPRRPRARLPDGVGARRVALGVRLRAQRDHVGELGHGVEVAERGEPLEAERVQPIAGQQREVGVVGRTTRPAP